MVNKKGRLYELDLLRFFAALAVVAFHYTVAVKRNQGFYLFNVKELNEIFSYGYLGAELFFMISGFVILMSAQNVSTGTFIKSRVVRLYPSFVPICIFSWIVSIALYNTFKIGIWDLFLNCSMLGLMFTQKYVSGVYWTLKIEMQFYILVGILIFFKQIKNVRFFLIFWLFISLFTHLILTYFPNLNYFRVFNVFKVVFFTQFSSFFIAGCFFYLIKYDNKKFDKAMPLLCMSSAFLLFPKIENSIIVNSFVISIFFGIFYLIALNRLNIKHHFVIIVLGSITYPLYLLHESLGEPLIAAMLAYEIGRPIIFLSVITLMILISFLFQKFVERPLTIKLKLLIFKKRLNEEFK